MKRAAVLAFAILSGCSLYWSHNSGDDTVSQWWRRRRVHGRRPYRDL